PYAPLRGQDLDEAHGTPVHTGGTAPRPPRRGSAPDPARRSGARGARAAAGGWVIVGLTAALSPACRRADGATRPSQARGLDHAQLRAGSGRVGSWRGKGRWVRLIATW